MPAASGCGGRSSASRRLWCRPTVIPQWAITATGPGAGQVGGESLLPCPCLDDCPPGGMKSRSLAAPGRCRNCRPRSGVMKQVGQDARIAAGNLYDLGAA
jgi:hypothetical protein